MNQPITPGAAGSTVVVFSDDWARHPSSCQHLVRHLLPVHRVLWVNTIGMRRPKLGVADVRRAAGRMAWRARADPKSGQATNPRVIAPLMYPGFRRVWQRRFNARRMAQAVTRGLAAGVTAGEGRVGAADESSNPRAPTIALTTLPITADLVGRLDADRWVYYCVDDFSTWPGLDGAIMDTMERELVSKVDAVVCASQVLRERVESMGREAELLTHGVDLEAWRQGDPLSERRHWWGDESQMPCFMFWGLIDERMEVRWVEALADHGVVWLIGPGQARNLTRHANIHGRGAVPHGMLREVAAIARVLVMPYIDAAVTRAMQPLKLLEYLATYKPVVVRDLPATRAWADCCDVVSTADEFVRVCLERAATGLPTAQRAAREQRLSGESWSEKARRFEAILHGSAGPSR